MNDFHQFLKMITDRYEYKYSIDGDSDYIFVTIYPTQCHAEQSDVKVVFSFDTVQGYFVDMDLGFKKDSYG